MGTLKNREQGTHMVVVGKHSAFLLLVVGPNSMYLVRRTGEMEPLMEISRGRNPLPTGCHRLGSA